MFRIYINYVWLCVSFLFKLHKYKSFLDRKLSKSAMRKFRTLRTPFEGKAQREIATKKFLLNRTEFFVYIASFLADEDDTVKLKEELEAPLAMMMLWMCEPIVSESNQDTSE